MLLDLTRYRRPVERLATVLQPDAVASSGDLFRVAAPAHVDVEVHKDKDRFRFVGTVTTELEVPCSRCLEPYRLPVQSAIDLRLLPESSQATQPDHEVEDEDLESTYYRDDQVDLGELVREQCYLALPMKPLCQEDCRGLCPVCGANRNTTPCDCAQAWEDPRLAPLKGLARTRPPS